MPHTAAISSSSQDVFENFYKQHLARRLLTGATAGVSYKVSATPSSKTTLVSFYTTWASLIYIYIIYPMKNDDGRKDSLDVT